MRDYEFSVTEYDNRLWRLRQALTAADLDGCVLFAPDSQCWLTGLETFIGALLPQILVVPTDESAPLASIIWDADAAMARETGRIDDIREYRFGVDDPVAVVRTVLRETVPPMRRVGIDLSTRAVPYALGVAVVNALMPIMVADCTSVVAEVRLVKSPSEIACLRRAGYYAEAGLEAMRRCARPGITERQLAAEIEYAMRRAGSDYPSIPTEMGSGSRALFGHGTPTLRVLAPGDMVHVEIGGVHARYNCVGIQTFCVGGAAPPAVGVRLYEIAAACVQAGLAVLRPGIEARAVEAPALDILRAAGMGDGFKMRFGYGVGLGYPPTWLDPLQITRTSTQRLVVGSTFVMHACVLDEAERAGVLVGGTYTISEGGVEMLAGAGAVELVTVG